MVSKNTLTQFTQSWNQTAAWAQSKGIKYNQYLPVYQMDSQRLIEYNSPMSTAERERAVLAAANPGQAFQSTPSTAGNPGNIVGNTVTDLRNIFTGIGDIAIHPLHNGLTDSLKNTFDLLDGSHHLTGKDDLAKLGDALTSTILSWIPGASDIGTVLQAQSIGAGLDELAEHPISSWLDVNAITSKLTALKVAGDADFADRVGLSTTDGPKPSLGRALTGYIKNTRTGRAGLDASGKPVQFMSINDIVQQMAGRSKLGTNPAIGELSLGNEMNHSEFTTEQKFIMDKANTAYSDLSQDQKAEYARIFDATDPKPIEDKIAESADPQVRQAAQDALDGPYKFQQEQALAAADGPIIVPNPKTGIQRIFSAISAPALRTARDAAQDATVKVLKLLPDLKKDSELTAQAERLLTQHTDQLDQARQAASQVKVGAGTFTKRLSGERHDTGLSKQGNVDKMFGEGGWISQIVAKSRQGDWENVEKLAKAAQKRFEGWDVRSVDAADAPEFEAVKQQVDQLGQAAEAALKIRKRTDLKVYGQMVKDKSLGPERDQLAKDQENTLKNVHKEQRSFLKKTLSEQKSRVRAANRLKRAQIIKKYWDQIHQQRAEIKAAVQDITDKYELEKAKATTAHLAARETHQAWLSGKRALGEVIPTDSTRQAEMGYGIREGMKGSKLAEIDDHARLEAQKQAEIQSKIAEYPPESTIKAQLVVEKKDLLLSEDSMLDQLDKQYQKDSSALGEKQAVDRKGLDAQHADKRAREGAVSKALADWYKTQREFSAEVWKHPPDVFTDVYFNTFFDHLMKHEHSQRLLAKTEKGLAEKNKWGEENIEDLRKNPKVLAQLAQLAIDGAMRDPIFDEIDEKTIQDSKDSAMEEVRRLDTEGHDPQYVPHISSTQVSAEERGNYGIHAVVGKGTPKIDVAYGRAWEMAQSRFDAMAGINRAIKQLLDRDATIDYVTRYLAPHVVTAADLETAVKTFYADQITKLSGQDLVDFIKQTAKEWGLETFDPQSMFSFSLPKWGTDTLYLDKTLGEAVRKITAENSLPTRGVYDKVTKLFRFSILGLSPRYTAHIVFGGSFLLALRSSPYVFSVLKQAHDWVKTGQVDEAELGIATNLGTPDYEIRTLKDAQTTRNWLSGKNQAHIMGQEELAKNGIDWKKASPLEWLKALGTLNLRFTGYVVHMQKAVALLDYAAKAERKGVFEDEDGNLVPMTEERAMYEGMKHAEKVMGDLRKMSPFEKNVARYAVPFYGWEKHILQYVLSFPGDHPWRAMMLANMAEYDTEHEAAGLPSRYQFLFFLGTPDAQGNVSVLDFRAMNPLRDVANYATLGGLISSLNPIVTSAFAMVDPSVTFGDNQLYPNLTYDQFYGIETAPPQGNLLTAIEGVVPQVSAIQQAMSVASAARGANTSSELKNIYEALNIPMFQVQHINLRQEAAKTALARYQVTKSLATTAWETGNFQPISDLGSVPDPRNADYETPVSELEQLYAQLSKEYPGTPPDEVAPPLPTVHL